MTRLVERGSTQLAFPGAVHRRAGIRADRRGAGGARRGLYIHPTARGITRHMVTVGSSARSAASHDVWLRDGDRILGPVRPVSGFPPGDWPHGREINAPPAGPFDWMQGNADGVPGRRARRREIQGDRQLLFRNNIWITTSGVAWEPAIRFSMEQLGAERVLYAMDYPTSSPRTRWPPTTGWT